MTDELGGLEIEERDEVVIARLTGELDLASAPETGQDIEGAVASTARGLVVDLSELDFIDSSGVAMLFALVRSLESRRQQVSVVSPEGRPVARVLEIVEFHRAAPVQADLDAAIAQIA